MGLAAVLTTPAPAATDGGPRDPWVTAMRSASSPGSADDAQVPGDLVDPFRAARGSSSSAHVSVDVPGGLDLKNPFERHASSATRVDPAPRGNGSPDLVEPVAHPVPVTGDEPGACTERASNGATVQRPDGMESRGCAPRGGPHLVNPFG